MTTKEFRKILKSDLLFYKLEGSDRYVALFDMCSIADAYLIVLVIYGSYYKIFCKSDMTGKDLVHNLYYRGFKSRDEIWEHIGRICSKSKFARDHEMGSLEEAKTFLVKKKYSSWSFEQLELKREKICDKIVEIEIGQLLV